MGDIFVVVIIAAIIIAAVAKIVCEKRRGAKCIGCPYSKADRANCACTGTNINGSKDGNEL